MATNVFVYWSDGLGGGGWAFDCHLVGMGVGVFSNENCLNGQAFDQCF